VERLSKGAVELLPIENRFYGPTVTVSGLLTGACLNAALPRGAYARFIIPDCMLKHGSTLFLDDMTVEDVERELQTPITVAPSNAAGLLAALFARAKKV
jgi:NifB/MoaA-like Fe-S oxidoreductase